jgi:hypothetical protein
MVIDCPNCGAACALSDLNKPDYGECAKCETTWRPWEFIVRPPPKVGFHMIPEDVRWYVTVVPLVPSAATVLGQCPRDIAPEGWLERYCNLKAVTT